MTTQLSIENETQIFELCQRKAKLLSTSTLVPKEFQGNMSNCAIGLNIAKRLGADEFMVLQNIDIIHGRPSFRATFLIAMVNASGRFSPMQFLMEGEGVTRSCKAYCKVLATGEQVEGPEVTMAMAKAEGWSTKAGSKWLTMPELMLRYRAAAFFARLYAPDITLGMLTTEESDDVPPPMKSAKGREMPEAVAGLFMVNPYAVTPSSEADPVLEMQVVEAPQAEPETKQDSDSESASVNEADERTSLTAGIKSVILENDYSMNTFGKICREAGLVSTTGTLKDVSLETLRTIAENAYALIQGTYTKQNS